jgi:RNA polymerase sigma-70 factor (ECF subfamily)
MIDSDDSLLVRQTLESNLHAFEILYRKYEKPIFNTIYRIVCDFDDATDITQNSFVKAYKNLGKFDERYKFFSWLYKISVNESLNFLKYRRKNDELSENIQTTERQPDERVLDTERDQQVQDALIQLSEDQRTVIVLFHFQDLSYSEIAQILEISEKTIKSRLFEGRQILKKLLTSVR